MSWSIRNCSAGAFLCGALLPACAGAGKPDPSDLHCTPTTPVHAASGYALSPFCAPNDPGPGNIWFSASGEALALTGYAFPPTSSGAAAFVDGWSVSFTRLLTTVDQIQLSENPDAQPGAQEITGGLVAEVDGPWAIDLSHSDPSFLAGKGGAGELAVPLAALNSQNKNGGGAFLTDGTRYALGFRIVSASDKAQNVNLDAAAVAEYADMVREGCSVLYVGNATFVGDDRFDGCVDAQHARWPKMLNFRLCFKSPTSYRNCQNPDNDPAQPFASEEHRRGIALLGNGSTLAQVTVHTDHPFWDSVLHDSPMHFDQFAARAAGQADGATVTLEDTKGVDYTAYTDSTGDAVTWRYCAAPATDVHDEFTGAMRFDPQTVPHAPGDNARGGLRDYYDFSTYDQSTQGHLNSDGLCFVQRDYPSPN